MAGVPYLPFSEEELFAGFSGALPAWLLLMLAPKWSVSHRVAALTAFLYSALYVGLLAGILQKSGLPEFQAMNSLKGVQSLLADKENTLLVTARAS